MNWHVVQQKGVRGENRGAWHDGLAEDAWVAMSLPKYCGTPAFRFRYWFDL
jgi:hypothetical protein